MEQREMGKFLSRLLCGASTTQINRLPEHDLLATVLATGISEAVGHKVGMCATSYKVRLVRQSEAQAWIDSDEIYINEENGISFSYICEALSVNGNAIRSALKKGDIPKYFSTHFRNREHKSHKKLSQVNH